MCAPSPPPTPDYRGAAQEQGAANIEAARLQGRYNNPNVINPYGTQTVTWDGDTPTLTQTFSPEQQALYEQQMRTQTMLGRLGQQGAESLFGVVGRNLDLSGMPQNGEALGPMGMLSVNAAPEALNSRNLPAMPQASEAIRNRVISAMLSRANQDFGRQREEASADLIARGLTPGSKGYEAEMDRLNRGMNDYRSQAEIAGGNAAEQAYGMDLSTRQQAAAEQAQRFGQLLSGDEQNFNQRGAAQELYGRMQGQRFGQQSDLRRAAIAELLAQRQTPLNEITALLSGSQVQNPFSMPGYAQNTQVAPPPIFGASQAQGAWDMNRYNQRVGSYNNMLSGLFSLGSAALGGGR